jgi:DNA ligase-1
VPATLLQFAHVNDSAAATPKKLQKQSILAAYFRALEAPADLRLAVRLASGRAFAATDERVLAVGGAIVWDVTLAIVGLDPHAFHDLVVRSGEIGEAIAQIWPGDAASGDAAAGDPAAGDPAAGDPASGDAAAGDPAAGDPAAGDPAAGDPAAGDPAAGDPAAGDPAAGDAARKRARSAFHADPDGLSLPSLHSHTLRQGDPSEMSRSVPLLLSDVADAFDRLAATGVVERKRAILLDLLLRCRTGREAAYVTKIIFGDLRTGVQDGVLLSAIAEAFGRSLASVQRCQFLTGDVDEVAILAREDALDVAQFRLFHPIQFMLATPLETPELAAQTLAGRSFFAEDKLDGIRAQVHKSGNRIAIYTRTMDRTDASFPDVVAAIARLPVGDVLLDGEIVPFRDGQVLPFAHIQKRLGRKTLSERALRENPAAFIAFDILYRDGQLLIDCPLHMRRAQLEALSASAPPDALRITRIERVMTAEQIAAAFAGARQRRNEGIVLKDPDSPYASGRRGQMWFKLKTHLPTFDCVVTAAEYGNGKRRAVLSDYTFAVWTTDPARPDAQLVNVGKAYSGLTDEEIARLTELFLSISRRQVGRVHLVEPRVVLEIACDQIQTSARHESGYALRFPRIKRIRWDKRPEDADRLARIAEIYQSTHNFARRPLAESKPKEPTLFD